MKEINLAATIAEERHKKGISQEELAQHMGVSKAAVSKWEKGLNYPEITLLPKLASYFELSIDSLMGYEPQMTKQEIRVKCRVMATLFASGEFERTYERCLELVKEYYSCYPFLLQMAILLLNHAMLAPEPRIVYEKAVELTARIRMYGDDVSDVKEAAYLESMAYVHMGEYQKALDGLDEQMRPMLQETQLLAQSYGNLDKNDRAREVLQCSMYQNLLALISDSILYIQIHMADMAQIEETIDRLHNIIESYEVEHLHPQAALQAYCVIMQAYTLHGMTQESLAAMRKYVDVSLHNAFPCVLHGDDYFDSIDTWIARFDLGNEALRDEKIIRQALVEAIEENTIFSTLHGNAEYEKMIKELRSVITG